MHRPRIQGLLDLPAELGRIQRLRRDLPASVTANVSHHLKRLGQVVRVEQNNVAGGAAIQMVNADQDGVRAPGAMK